MSTPALSPHSLEAEAGVLGAILIRADALFDAASIVDGRDFFRLAHRQIFDTMLALSSRGAPVEFITVVRELTSASRIDDVGGPAYLASLADGMPRSANVAAYAGIVRDLAQKRRLIAAAQGILDAALTAHKDSSALVDDAERAIFAVSDRGLKGSFIDGKALAAECYAHLQARMEGKATTGLKTGFTGFDFMTHGLQPGALVLIAARPSMGKSAFALSVAFHAATNGHHTGFISLEMGRKEVGERIVAAEGRVDLHRLRGGRLGDAEFTRIGEAIGQIAESRIHVDETACVSAMEIRGKARRLQAQHGLDLLVVDYLQLMQVSKAENRNLAIADISRSLKLLARELSIPVVALSQLSRETERRGDKRPMLSDLRDSGALEQDADLVAFLHRPEVYQETPDNAGVAELIVAKQRNGPTGIVPLRWVKEFTRFEDAA